MKVFKFSILAILSFFLLKDLAAQTDEELQEIKQLIWYQGLTLYDLESAAWAATGILLEKYSSEKVRGHLPYKEGNTYKTIFFNYPGDTVQILFTFTFDYPISAETCIVDATERGPNEHENILLMVRDSVITNIENDTNFFQYFPDFMYNFGFIENEESFIAYAFSRTMDVGYIPLGNDYKIVLSKDGAIQSREVLHDHIIKVPIKADYKTDEYTGTKHTHIDNESPYMTPTDINTLLYHKALLKWDVHITESNEYRSIFNLKTKVLEIERKN